MSAAMYAAIIDSMISQLQALRVAVTGEAGGPVVGPQQAVPPFAAGRGQVRRTQPGPQQQRPVVMPQPQQQYLTPEEEYALEQAMDLGDGYDPMQGQRAPQPVYGYPQQGAPQQPVFTPPPLHPMQAQIDNVMQQAAQMSAGLPPPAATPTQEAVRGIAYGQ